MSASQRTGVIVLGMHRSGTSAFARVASLLGCDLPNNLMAADEGNELGHWESYSVTQLNEKLLASAGSKWDDWMPLNEGWSQSSVSAAFLAEAQEVLRVNYGDSPLFVLKDPRICRLAPFWLTAIENLDIRPIIALPIRNPYEVSNSLAARDGSDQGYGLLLWLRHVLDAETATRGLPRHFFTFNQLLSDWGNVVDEFEQKTGVHFPRRSVTVETEISTFLTTDAWNQREANGETLNAAAPAWVRDAYAILQKWCVCGEQIDDYSRLDEIRADFDEASPTFGRLIAKGIKASKGYGMGARTRSEAEQQQQEAAQTQVQFDEARNEIERLRQEAVQAAQTQVQLEEAHNEIERLRQEAARAVQVQVQLEQNIDSMNTATFRMEAELAELGSALRQRQEEASQAWSKVENEQTLRERAEAEQKRLITQNEELVAQFFEIDKRIRADSNALTSAELRANDAEKALEQMSRQHEKMLVDMESQAAQLRQALSQSTRADSELAQSKISHANAQHQIRELAEIASKAKLSQERISELEGIASKVGAYQEEMATLHKRAQNAEQSSRQARSLLENRQSETVMLKEMMARQSAQMDKQAQWLQEATVVLQKKPKLRAMMFSKTRRQYSRDMLKASGLFDAESYLKKNPDVAESGDDPLLHYVRHGLREGRPR